MKQPTDDDARRCLDYRKMCKRTGCYMTSEQRHCEKMLRKFPEWYTATQEEVFNDTVPVGSNVRYKGGKK